VNGHTLPAYWNWDRIPAGDVGGEGFWKQVKENFSIRKGLIMLNAANLCPSPYPVQQRVFELTRDIDADPSSHNRKCPEA